MLKKKVIKEIKKAEKPEKAKKQYLFRNDRVEAKKKEGWKVVAPHVDKKHAELEELTLMER